MPKDTVVKGYLFEVFDFEEFSKENVSLRYLQKINISGIEISEK